MSFVIVLMRFASLADLKLVHICTTTSNLDNSVTESLMFIFAIFALKIQQPIWISFLLKFQIHLFNFVQIFVRNFQWDRTTTPQHADWCGPRTSLPTAVAPAGSHRACHFVRNASKRGTITVTISTCFWAKLVEHVTVATHQLWKRPGTQKQIFKTQQSKNKCQTKKD